MTQVSEESINFQEDGDKNGYVMVCKHVANKTRPVLLVEMQPPYDHKHSGWEAICNVGGDDDCDVYVELSMEDFLEYEPSLKELIKDPEGLPQISRESKGSPWKVLK